MTIASGSGAARPTPLSARLSSLFFTAVFAISLVSFAPVSPASSLDADAGLVTLSDEELDGVTGGDFELALEGFDILIGDNEAGMFSMDIAQNAFDSASGIFTTLQAVNSAVNLSVIVNIYLNGQGT